MQKVRNMPSSRPELSIELSHPRDVYTTLDEINGTVSITAPSDVAFDDIEIEFVGTSKTYVERLTNAAAASGRSNAFHSFLKMADESVRTRYPSDRILRAGKTYSFPFHFVLPQQLLPRVCTHKVISPTLRECHIQLPPTFGDKDVEGTDEDKGCDDMVPEMASIRYGVHARVSKNQSSDQGSVRTTIVNQAKRLRIIPVSAEQPPLDLSEDPEYITRRERALRKGMLQGKLGSLVIEAMQPPTMHMRARANPDEPTTSTATIALRFDPVEEGLQPPRLGSLSTKLKVCTNYASTGRSSFPTKQAATLDLSQGSHSEQLTLSSRCMGGVHWHKHHPRDAGSRRDSACSTRPSSPLAGRVPAPSETYQGKAYYTAELTVPVTLPRNKTFVPTFHSCLISRTYQLKFELGIQTAGFGGTMDLKLPLQICCQGSAGDSNPRSDGAASGIDGIAADKDDDDDLFDYLEFSNLYNTAFPGHDRFHTPARGRIPLYEAPPVYSYIARGSNVAVH
jgi:hypothetical protein